MLALAAPAGAEIRPLPVWDGYVLEPYGQFHFAYQRFDDGLTRTENLVDVTNANSRFGFYLQPQDGAQGLVFHFESGLGFRASQKTSQVFTPDFWDWKRTDLRKVQFVYEGRFGTVKLGQGSMPIDGAAEVDLGKTVVVAKSTIPEANGSYILRNSAGALTGIVIGHAFDNFDGDRRLRLRYDTPLRSGVSFSAAFGQEVLKSGDDNDYYGFALRYGGKFRTVEVKAAIGTTYARNPSGVTRTTIGSASLLHLATGLNLSVAAGEYGIATKPRYLYVKGGWNTHIVAAGQTKFVAEYFRGRDYVTAGAASHMWSFGLIQEFDRPNLEAYAGYRNFSYDDLTPVSYLDAGALQIGTRWRF